MNAIPPTGTAEYVVQTLDKLAKMVREDPSLQHSESGRTIATAAAVAYEQAASLVARELLGAPK